MKNKAFTKLIFTLQLFLCSIANATYYFDPIVVTKILKENGKRQSSHHACLLMLLEKELLGTNLEYPALTSLEKFVAKNLLEHLNINITQGHETAIQELIFAMSCEAQEHSGQACQYCLSCKDALLNSRDQIAIYLKLAGNRTSWLKTAGKLVLALSGAALIIYGTILFSKKNKTPGAQIPRKNSIDSQVPTSTSSSEIQLPRVPNNTPMPSPAEPRELSFEIGQLATRLTEIEEKLHLYQASRSQEQTQAQASTLAIKQELEAQITQLRILVQALTQGNLENIKAANSRISEIELRVELAMQMQRAEIDKILVKELAKQLEQLNSLGEKITRLESGLASASQSKDSVQEEIAYLKDQFARCAQEIEGQKIQLETFEAAIRQQPEQSVPVPEVVRRDSEPLDQPSAWAQAAGDGAPDTPGAAAARLSSPKPGSLPHGSLVPPPHLISTTVLYPPQATSPGPVQPQLPRMGRPRDRSTTLEPSLAPARLVRAGSPISQLPPRPASPGHSRQASPTRPGLAVRALGALERAADRTTQLASRSIERARATSPIRSRSPKTNGQQYQGTL